MALRGLLLRLTMLLVPLGIAVDTAPATTRTHPQPLDIGLHLHLQHQHSPPPSSSHSVRNFFKRTIERADLEVPPGESGPRVEFEVNCSSEAAMTGDQDVLVYEPTSSSSSSFSSTSLALSSTTTSSSSSSSSSTSSSSSSPYHQTPSPGLLLRGPPHPHHHQPPSEGSAWRAFSQAMVSCGGAKTTESTRKTPQDSKKHDENLTLPQEMYDNLSLSLDNGVKMSPIGEEGERLPFRCSYKAQVPALWSAVIKDESLLCVVNPHWLTYVPPSHLHHVLVAALYIVIMVFGLVGNGLVIFLFVSSRSLRTPSNIFILNLAVSDFLLVAMMGEVVHNSLLEGPAMGRVGCDLYAFVGGLTGTTSIMTLAAISFDRYLVISYPLDPFKKLSHRQVLTIILATWLYSFTFSVIPLVGLEDINYSPEGFLTTCSFDYLSRSTNTRVYIFAFFVAAWVVPLHIIVFSYLSIVTTVSKQERYCRTCQGTFASSFKHQRLKRKKGVELKLTKVASGIIALWMVAWTPYAVVSLLGIFGQQAVITPFVSMVPAFFCKTAACLDPFIYALSHPRFKTELTNKIMRRRPHLLGGVLNGIAQGFSVSTFSEIREDREHSDGQTIGKCDPSTTSLGPLLQRRTSSSSNPTLDRRRREVAGSPGSKSLASPISTEMYPRKSLSTYSFRSMSRTTKCDDRVEGVHRDRRHDKRQLELRTTALMDLPNAPRPKPPFSFSCSFTTGLERVNLCTQPSPRLWSAAPKSPAAEEHPAEDHLHAEMESLRRKTKTCVKNYSAVASSAAGGRARTKGRSNSLPDMTHGTPDRKPEGKFSKNVLLQILHGKILPGARRNRSSSSIFHDDGKV